MIEGVFLASAHRFEFDVTGPPGSGELVVATRFYVLAGDGRFHRGWGLPEMPGGRIASYDFAAPEAEDPYNTGTYSLDGDAVVFQPASGDAERGAVVPGGLLAEERTFELATAGSA